MLCPAFVFADHRVSLYTLQRKPFCADEDFMSESQTFGREGNEIAAGYKPLGPPPASDAAPPKDGITKLPAAPENMSVEEAAGWLGKHRSSDDTPIERKLHDAKTGEPFDRKFSMTAERAAHELSEGHRAEEAARTVEADLALGEAVDAARERAGIPTDDPARPGEAEGKGDDAAADHQGASAAQDDDGSGLSARARELLAIPEVADELERKFGEAEQLKATIAQEIDYASRLATTAVLMAIPELAGMPLEHVPGALAMLAQHNPARHAQVMAQMQTAQALQTRHAQLQRADAEQKAQQFDAWSQEQDAKFMKSNPEFADPDKAPAERGKVIDYLKSVGVPEAQIPKLWKTELFRDAVAQQIVRDAAAYREGKLKMQAAVQRLADEKNTAANRVVRPGTIQSRGSDNSERIESLSARLPTLRGEAAARGAAALMAARRNGRR